MLNSSADDDVWDSISQSPSLLLRTLFAHIIITSTRLRGIFKPYLIKLRENKKKPELIGRKEYSDSGQDQEVLLMEFASYCRFCGGYRRRREFETGN